MKRVRRQMPRDEAEQLRDELIRLIPQANSSIPAILRTMRLLTKKSQAEYARMCGVAPRVYADMEAGKGNSTVDTLNKLLRPFGYAIGVVVPAPPQE